MKARIMSVDQRSNVCTVVRSINFGISSRTELLFDLNQSFLFLSNKEFNSQSFLFSETNCWASPASFSKLSFGEILLCIVTEV